jgi:uncharacterized protein YcgI (DUF1989 family)
MSLSLSPECSKVKLIPKQSGTAFRLAKGETLTIRDPEGGQVSDLFCFPADDLRDGLSSGRSIDYNETIAFTEGHVFWSHAGRKLMTIVDDSCGVHDFLVTPCSQQMFRMIAHDETLTHPSCLENLSRALAEFDVDPTRISTTFNAFMNVPAGANGRIQVLPPKSKAGDTISFRAETDLIVGLTACSDPGSNGGCCKPIQYYITR